MGAIHPVGLAAPGRVFGITECHAGPGPIVQDTETLQIAKQQSYIFWLSHLGVEAQRRGHGPEFAAAVSRMIFGGTKGWNAPAVMADAAATAELDLAEMEAAIRRGDHAREIERNQNLLKTVGHWGVPTFVFRGEPFFGQGRVELLRWRMEREAVPPREQA